MLRLRYFYFLFSPLYCHPKGLELWFDDDAFNDQQIVVYCEEDDEMPEEESTEEDEVGFTDIILFVSVCFSIASLIFCGIKCSERFSFQ